MALSRDETQLLQGEVQTLKENIFPHIFHQEKKDHILPNLLTDLQIMEVRCPYNNVITTIFMHFC